MAKMTKADAAYTETPRKDQGRCRDCTMERSAAHACSAVAGPIRPDAHCELFERKPNTKGVRHHG